MKIEYIRKTLLVSEISEINANNATDFRDEVRARILDGIDSIEFDLSQTRFVDSAGLGALFAVYKTAEMKDPPLPIRFVNPRPPVRQLIELVQFDSLCEIVTRNAVISPK